VKNIHAREKAKKASAKEPSSHYITPGVKRQNDSFSNSQNSKEATPNRNLIKPIKIKPLVKKNYIVNKKIMIKNVKDSPYVQNFNSKLKDLSKKFKNLQTQKPLIPDNLDNP